MAERLPYPFNIKYETARHNKFAHLASIPFAEMASLLSTTSVTGSIPTEGPAIIISNHISWKDPFILHWLALRTARRTIRTMARRTLADPSAKESELALSRRTQQDHLNTTRGILKKLLRHSLIAPYIKSFNPILVDIGGNSLGSLREAIKELKQERMVGIFIQGTRKPRLDLLDIMDGAAVLAQRVPGVPIVPMGMSGTDGGLTKHIALNIGPTFTAEEIPLLKGQDRTRQISLYIANRIGELVEDLGLIPAWWLHRKCGMPLLRVQELATNQTHLLNKALGKTSI